MEETSGIANSSTKVTIEKPAKIIHFSDGVIEDIEEERINNVELDSAAVVTEENVDPKTLSWGPWFSYYAWKSGTKMLNAIDYTGESLADFFGITTPKYQIEIDEYNRMQEEKKKLEEESAGWVVKEGGDIPLVLNEPLKDNNECVKDNNNPAKV